MQVADAPPTIATVLDPRERPLLDAAAGGRFTTIHAESMPEALRAVRERPVDAVLLSAEYVPRDHVPAVATLIRAFPTVRALAVVSRHDADSSERLLDLGASGVRTVVDLTQRDGWRELRNLLAQPGSPTAARILARVMPALGEAPEDCQLCFQTLVRLAPRVTTVRGLCCHYGLPPSTFVSRFFRAGLPSPKRYLAAIRLVYVAALLESRGLSIADAAYRLEYSSPQSFGRHLRANRGLCASDFRRTVPFERALSEFTERMIVPFRAVLRAFHPLETQGYSASGPGSSGRSEGTV
jgi:AraC-like DNA-binding protein